MLDSGEVKFLLYGGALGGGKSYLLRWYALRRLMILNQHFGLDQPVGMLACEDYPSLKDRQLSKISREMPVWMGKLHQDNKDYGRCFILKKRWGGGVLCFRNLDDPSKYASAEFAFILVDELTKNEYDVFTFLRSRLRWPGLPDVEAQFVGGTNPGSIGHGWVKLLWIDKRFGDEWVKPIDYRSQFAFVPSLADDNPHLGQDYWAMLNTLPTNLREAFRYGRWDIFVGQAFPELTEGTHGVANLPIPRNAQIYMSYDWGFGAPFSIGWWWVDADNRLYRFAEWYGFDGQQEGLRMADSNVAEGIGRWERDLAERFKLPLQEFWVEPEPGRKHLMSLIPSIMRFAGHDCFQRRPDVKGGGQGPSTAEVFSRYGIHLIKGDSTRHLKIRQFRERIRLRSDDGLPMLVAYKEQCPDFFRTVSNLIMDEHDIEDVDTTGEDHVYDEACHICMARPLSLEMPKKRKSEWDRRIDELESPQSQDTLADHLAYEQEAFLREVGADDFIYGQVDEYVDTGEMVDTV